MKFNKQTKKTLKALAIFTGMTITVSTNFSIANETDYMTMDSKLSKSLASKVDKKIKTITDNVNDAISLQIQSFVSESLNRITNR